MDSLATTFLSENAVMDGTQEVGSSTARDGEPPLSDHSLLRRLRAGSQDAATQLYVRYADRLRALTRAQCSPDLARRVDVDDIVQSVFGSFFRRASHGLYDVPDGEELWGLFLVIALNKIRASGNFHRAARRDVRLTSGGSCLDEATASDPERDDTATAFLQLVIDDVLEKLPAQQKRMILLRIEGYEVTEIAALTGRSKRTTERVLQDFRKKLADLLHGEDVYEHTSN
jgi:RNA polymerase sigma-70 factor, ECF subfamily